MAADGPAIKLSRAVVTLEPTVGTALAVSWAEAPNERPPPVPCRDHRRVPAHRWVCADLQQRHAGAPCIRRRPRLVRRATANPVHRRTLLPGWTALPLRRERDGTDGRLRRHPVVRGHVGHALRRSAGPDRRRPGAAL